MTNVPRDICFDFLGHPLPVLEQFLVFLGTERRKLALHVNKDEAFLPHPLPFQCNLLLDLLSRKNFVGKAHSCAQLALQTYHLVRVCGLLGTSLSYCFALTPPEADIRFVLRVGFVQLHSRCIRIMNEAS